MIAKHLKRRIELLFFFLKKTETSIKEISEILAISQRTAKEDIIKLNLAFHDHLNLPQFILSQTSGVITINPTYKEHAVNDAYKLKLILLKQSASFNFLILLTTQGTVDKSVVLEKLFITEAYLQKITQQLNKYLKKYQLQITQQRGSYTLTGDEQIIRVFSYILIHDSYQSLEWPFTSLSIAEIRENASPELVKYAHTFSQSKKRQLSILYAIFVTRCQSGHFSSLPTDENITQIMQILKRNFDTSALVQLDHIQALSNERKENEILFFNLFSRLFLSDAIDKSQKIKVAKCFYTADQEYCHIAKQIFTRVLSDYVIDEESTYFYVYFLVLVHTWYQYMGDTFVAFIDLFLPSSKFLVQKEAPEIETITRKIDPLLKNKNEALYMAQVISSLLLSNVSPKLKIYLQLTKNYTAIFLVKKRLAALFNEQNIVFIQDFSKADFIITDTFEHPNEQKTFFYLDSIRNPVRWTELSNAIQQTYMAKLQEMQTALTTHL
jgi:Transcriptional antiterminator